MSVSNIFFFIFLNVQNIKKCISSNDGFLQTPRDVALMGYHFGVLSWLI